MKKIALILLAASLFACAQGTGAATFDYYILSLSWAPEFCAQPAEAAANPLECGHSRGFIVHGLWPESDRGRSPEDCGGRARSVSRGIVNDMLQYMPGRSLIQHEWATHGTCTGLSQSQYFTRVALARADVQIPVQISALTEAAKKSPAEIEGQFAEANPKFPRGAFRTACRNRELTEVRACFDKDMNPQTCTRSAGECDSIAITIRPPQ